MTYRALSLGAGQGSTALVIAIADKLVVRGYDFGAIALDRVTFADTGGELQATYSHLARLTEYLAPRGIRVETVRARGLPLREKVLARARGEIKSGAPAVPFFLGETAVPVTVYPDVEAGEDFAPYESTRVIAGRAKQHCTYDFKSKPLDRVVRRDAKSAGKLNDVEVVIGFTCEEMMRMRGPRKDWPEGWRFRYPMIEAGVNRGWAQDVCRAALGSVPPSSACAFCPHRPDTGAGGRAWIKEHEPETWAKVVEFDAAIRHGYMGLQAPAYISKLRLPVDDALRAASAQGEFWDENGGNGCDDGRCFT